MNSISASVAQAGATVRSSDLILRRERRFFTGMAIAMAVMCFVGFAPSYYLRAQFGAPAFGPLVHVHGAAYTMWILLLVAQTSLVAAGRTQWHRRLGVAGAVLAVAMIVLGAAVAVNRGKTPMAGMSHEATLAFLAIAFVALLVFPALVGAAIYLRKNAAAHKRLMLLGTIEILTAAFGRISTHMPSPFNTPPVFFAVTDLFILAIVVYDLRTRGRLHPATLWGGLLVIASQPLRLMLAGSQMWMDFARWITGT
jgi:hypothetical protein